ncbi:MAG: hypothetical protein ACOYD4_14375 [Solirubrobacterales bacterium]
MRRKLISPKPTTAVPVTRLAWWAAFLTTLVLIVGLNAVRSATAAVLPPIGPVNVPGIVEPDEEEAEEGEELEAEECEAAAEGDEEGKEEEEECEANEVGFAAPPACFLSNADAAVSVDLDHEKLRLAVRYEAYAPATVAVDYSLRGNRGSLNLKGDQERFGRSGVFHLTQSLTEAQTKRVAAAKSFTVTVRPINAPHSCNALLDQYLSVRRAAPGGTMWVDSESTFRHARRH